ncbi:MAG: GrpB family protein [Pseudomonadota bacterium]
MPAPIKVQLHAHDPQLARLAASEGQRICRAADAVLIVHHIGSTAIPDIVAKPVIDLLGVVNSLVEFDLQQHTVEALGYSWHGEYGLAGRRYCKLDDPMTGARKFQLHCYAEGDPSIVRHLAFRDYLHAHPLMATEYAAEKQRCAALRPKDSHQYSDCKADWIARVERTALDWFAARTAR